MTLQLNRGLTAAQAAGFLGLSEATLEKGRVVGVVAFFGAWNSGKHL